MKRAFRRLCAIVLSLVVFFLLTEAQMQTQSVLYLKNRSVIRCNIVSILRDTSITIQTTDTTLLTFSYNQMDSLIYAPVISSSLTLATHLKPRVQSKPSTSGLFFGGMFSSDGNSRGSFTVGGQTGSGLNPGILLQLGMSSGISEGNVLVYGVIGPRFGKLNDSSSFRIFFTPLIGALVHEGFMWTLGFSIDVYPLRKLFCKVQLLQSIDGPSTASSGSNGALFQFALGYGIN
jgi:hypothetical protein